MKTIIFCFMLILISSPAMAETSLGKIIQMVGDVDITSNTTGKQFVPDIGTSITRDHKIRTGKKAFVEILLDDGTKLFIREISVLSVSGLKLEEKEPPTQLKMLTGKIRLALKKTFRSKSLILKTPTAIAAVRGTDFGVIAGKYETRIVVFNGTVEVANTNADVIKSQILNEREESSVKQDMPPSRPVVVPGGILESWFDYYNIDEKNRIIIKSQRENGIIDNLLRKKDH